MNVSKLFIERPIATLLLMAGVIIFGVYGYFSLPVSELPNVDFPTIFVRASLPGADPETMASAVATPLENAFSAVNGITSMTSSSSQGYTGITLQFRLDRNLDAAAQDVQSAISETLRRLPRAMPYPPAIHKINPSADSIYYIVLTSKTLPVSRLDLYARTVLVNQLSMVDGVGQATVHGPAKFAVRIQADPTALAARHLSLLDIANAVNATSIQEASGTLSGPVHDTIIHTNGQLTDADAFRRQIIAVHNGAPIQLGDVAKVLDSVESVRSADWYNDDRAVTVEVQPQPGSNTIAVVKRIEDRLPEFRAQLPAGIDMHIFYDQSKSIRAAIDDVQITLLIACGLVVLVILLFLRKLSATLIPSLALPISVIGTFAGMAILGYSLDNLSLLALTLSVGFVVDDAIVMLENIVRHIEAGETPYQAALNGSREIGFTILSMTVSLAAVFIPVVFMAGVAGRLLHEFAITIVLAILISGVVSVTLTPALAARVLKQTENGLHPAFNASERAFQRLFRLYRDSLHWSMRHKPIVMAVFALSIALSWLLFATMKQDFLPSDDRGLLRGEMETAVGTSFDQYIRYVKTAREIVEHDPNVAGLQSDEGGSLVIALKPLSERSLTADQIASELRKELNNIPGTKVTITNPPAIRIGGRSSRSTYQYTLKGLDLEQLQTSARALMHALEADPALVGVDSDLEQDAPAVEVSIDRNKAAMLGITPDQIQQTLGYAFGGQQISQIYAPADQYQVILELVPQFQRDPTSLVRLFVTGANGSMVPLGSVARFHIRSMPLAINHSGQIPSITLSFDMAPGKSLSDAVSAVTNATTAVGLPDSVEGSFSGNAAAFQDTSASLGWLLLAAIVVVYIILGMLYESLVHPLTILSGLPSAALGALLILYADGVPISLYAFVGMIMLIGIVKKNAIMMVDFALQQQRGSRGLAVEDAIVEAALTRFRPIMMTTFAAIMGTLPIVFSTGMGADARRPLGLCVAGGLLLSQLLTLYITPVIFVYLDRTSLRGQTKVRADFSEI